jgi:hypothetical protein
MSQQETHQEPKKPYWNSYPKKMKKEKPIKFIPKMSAKRAAEVVKEKTYYREVIKEKRKLDGKCYCEECELEILHPKGRNVSHIVGKGANEALYLDKRNNFLLCVECEHQWTAIDPTVMKIYPKALEINVTLTREYYDNKKVKV